MTEVLQSPRFSSSSTSSPFHPSADNGVNTVEIHHTDLSSSANLFVGSEDLGRRVEEERVAEGGGGDTLSLLALLVTVFRKSMVACKTDEEGSGMEIGWPTDVRHVAHVTFDRFNGFLGLPDEFEPDVPRAVPSASTSIFGVSTESMQCSFDSRGNSIPTILMRMQRKLYAQGGLQAEGIFRINAENSQEEYVRDQLNKGIVPDSVDIHCLAGLIKAWFRELPKGVLDSLSPEQVMQSNTEEDCVQLVGLLPSTEACLLDWAVNLMSDVVQEEHLNKMNARNISMVFAPNMTKMADPLTALMYAVQVLNFLKTLILKTLRERQESVLNAAPSSSQPRPSDRNDHHNPSQCSLSTNAKEEQEQEEIFYSIVEPSNSSLIYYSCDGIQGDENKLSIGAGSKVAVECAPEEPFQSTPPSNGAKTAISCSKTSENRCRIKNGSNARKVATVNKQNTYRGLALTEKSKGVTIVSHINSSYERVEAWR